MKNILFSCLLGASLICSQSLFAKCEIPEQGPPGPAGATGPTGAVGPTGPGGGDTGPTGPQGVQGPTGDTGPQGIQGVQGDTGPQGVQGDTGPQGVQGVTGLQGVQGDTGPQGVQGDTGPQGVQGVTGLQGVQGDTGPQGVQGDTGPQGVQGDTGPQGVQGDTGPQGVQGDTGPQGVQGDTGPQGVQGETGPTGPTGTLTTSYISAAASSTATITGAVNTFQPVPFVLGSAWVAPSGISLDANTFDFTPTLNGVYELTWVFNATNTSDSAELPTLYFTTPTGTPSYPLAVWVNDLAAIPTPVLESHSGQFLVELTAGQAYRFAFKSDVSNFTILLSPYNYITLQKVAEIVVD